MTFSRSGDLEGGLGPVTITYSLLPADSYFLVLLDRPPGANRVRPLKLLFPF
jgi:hypothetical protein